jgi:hypothetical protein
MSKDEVVKLLKNGRVLRQIGSLSLQSKFDSGEVVSHQVMQGLAYSDLIKPEESRGPNARWVLHIC